MTHDVTLEYWQGLARRLDEATHGDRDPLIAGAVQLTGLSTATVYRRLRGVGWHSGRKLRADKGDSALSLDAAKTIANLMFESRRTTGKRLLSCADALEIARANGLIDVLVSPETAMRVMRLHGIHPDQLARATPHQSLKSLHPNHVWEIDASVCVLFYLSSGGLAAMDRDRFYKNKPANVARVSRDLCVRYVCTDHTSGAIQVRYVVGAGETQEALFEALMQFVQRDADPRLIVHGVPLVLLWDKGAANTSHLIQHLLSRLQVQAVAHAAGNSRAKGQVEAAQNIVERSFEGRLYLLKVRDLDHLNAQAQIWCRWFNAERIHSRHGLTRYAAWQRIREDQLRIAPARELCELLLRTKPEPRKVQGELCVQYAVPGYGSQVYSVAHVPDVRVGEQVLVAVNPYRAPNIDVILVAPSGAETIYECPPLRLDAHGFRDGAPVIGTELRSQRDDALSIDRKAMARDAWDSDTDKGVRAKRDAKEPAFAGKVDPITFLDERAAVEHMARRGTALDTPAVAEVVTVPLSVTEACKRLKNEMGARWSGAFFQQIRDRFPDGVPEAALPALAAELLGEAPATTTPAAPRLAVVK